MTLARPDWRDRLRAAIPTGVIVAGLGYALVIGLGYAPRPAWPAAALDSFDVTPPAPPPPAVYATPPRALSVLNIAPAWEAPRTSRRSLPRSTDALGHLQRRRSDRAVSR